VAVLGNLVVGGGGEPLGGTAVAGGPVGGGWAPAVGVVAGSVVPGVSGGAVVAGAGAAVVAGVGAAVVAGVGVAGGAGIGVAGGAVGAGHGTTLWAESRQSVSARALPTANRPAHAKTTANTQPDALTEITTLWRTRRR
jgi:hypothetical protein